MFPRIHILLLFLSYIKIKQVLKWSNEILKKFIFWGKKSCLWRDKVKFFVGESKVFWGHYFFLGKVNKFGGIKYFGQKSINLGEESIWGKSNVFWGRKSSFWGEKVSFLGDQLIMCLHPPPFNLVNITNFQYSNINIFIKSTKQC